MKAIVFFRFKPETVGAMIDHPTDRQAAVRKMLEAAGGRIESYYWMFGEHDGFVIAEVPASKDVAAVALAVSSSGAFAHLETHELIEPGQIDAVLKQAKVIRESYVPPTRVPTHA
jgi:uncharacterized protein with GYD domain